MKTRLCSRITSHAVPDMRASVEKSGLSIPFLYIFERTARCYTSLLILNCVLRFEEPVMSSERLRKKLEEQGFKNETIDKILDWYSAA